MSCVCCVLLCSLRLHPPAAQRIFSRVLLCVSALSSNALSIWPHVVGKLHPSALHVCPPLHPSALCKQGGYQFVPSLLSECGVLCRWNQIMFWWCVWGIVGVAHHLKGSRCLVCDVECCFYDQSVPFTWVWACGREGGCHSAAAAWKWCGVQGAACKHSSSSQVRLC
jgi:hypothetical protein